MMFIFDASTNTVLPAVVGGESPTPTDSTINIQALFSPPEYESSLLSGYPGYLPSSQEPDLEFREPISTDNRKVVRIVNTMGKETLIDLGSFYKSSSSEGTVTKDLPGEDVKGWNASLVYFASRVL